MARRIVDADGAAPPHAARTNNPFIWLVWFVLFIWLNQTDRFSPLVRAIEVPAHLAPYRGRVLREYKFAVSI